MSIGLGNIDGKRKQNHECTNSSKVVQCKCNSAPIWLVNKSFSLVITKAAQWSLLDHNRNDLDLLQLIHFHLEMLKPGSLGFQAVLYVCPVIMLTAADAA